MHKLFLLLALLFAFGPMDVEGVEAKEAHPSIPSGAIPDGLGINIHFTQALPGGLEMLAATGATWVRMDFGWGKTERELGVYDFSEYDKLVADLEKHRLRAVFILDYGNKLYSPVSPATPESRAAFARWAAAAVSHFKGRGILWEMWNEPNIGFWRPKPSAPDYVALALETGKAIRLVAPGEAFIGPTLARFDWPFFEEVFKGGLLEYFDAVSVHPYRNTAPDTAAADYAQLRALIAKYATEGKTIPILSGEWGYSSSEGRLTEEQQARYLQRMWLTNIVSGVPLSIWYDWRDDGDDPKESEHRYGMVRRPHFPQRTPAFDAKPAYFAAQKLIRELKGFRFEKRIATGDERDWVLIFANGKDTKIAAWTAVAGGREVVIPRATFATQDVAQKSRSGIEVLMLRLSPAVTYFTP